MGGVSEITIKTFEQAADSNLLQIIETPFYVAKVPFPVQLPPAYFGDTLNLATANGKFFQTENILIHPELSGGNSLMDWIILILIVLTVVLSLIWFFFPERVYHLISKKEAKNRLKYANSQFAKPGLFIYVAFTLSVLFSTTVFFYNFLLLWFPAFVKAIPSLFLLFFGIVSLLLGYFIIRMFIIWFVGFIFNRRQQSKLLLENYYRLDLILGFTFIPLAFLSMSPIKQESVMFGVVFFVIIIVLKWFRLFKMGLSLANVSVFHIILYLCALEIIPVFVMAKLYEIYFAV